MVLERGGRVLIDAFSAVGNGWETVLMLHRLVVATDRIEIDGAHANEDLIPERRRSDEDGFDTRMAVDEGDEKRMIPRADVAIIVVC